MPEVEVRPLVLADFAAVTALLSILGRPAPTPATSAALRAVFADHLADPSDASLVATRHGEVVGVLIMHIRRRLNHTTPEAWIPDLIVAEHERGSGMARTLFRAGVALARARGCHRLVLESGYPRARAHRFYLSEGMTDVGKYFSLELG